MDICSVCLKPKANFECGLCKNAVCKGCAQFIDEKRFSFYSTVPEVLSHEIYCTPCFDTQVAPEMSVYDELMEQAKNVFVFDKKQGKETRLIERKQPTAYVKDCDDHDETILRLAFMAVQGGFNAVVDIEVSSQKFKDGSYTILKWNGSGVPALVDAHKHNRP